MRLRMRHLPLVVLLGCLFLCQPLLAQDTLCPCWPQPDAETGECSETQMPLVYSHRETPQRFTQCVNRQGYDARYGALLVTLCFNRACLPEAFRSTSLTLELIIREADLQDMEEGEYVSNFLGPPSQGGNVFRTFVTASKQQPQGVEEVVVLGAGATLEVPPGGLSQLRIEWRWPDQLNPNAVGNQAAVIMRNASLADTPLQWPGLPGTITTEEKDPCAHVKAVGVEAASAARFCERRQVPVWVTRTGEAFAGLNPLNLPPPTELVAALMCMDPPEYNQYNQLLEWDFTWDFTCWESRALPFVFQMAEVPSEDDSDTTSIRGLRMPTNARMRLFTRGAQVYREQGVDDRPSMIPFVTVRQVNKPFFDGLGPLLTFSRAGDDFTFHFPSEGITSIAISTQVWGPFEQASPGEAKYLGLITVPGEQMRGGIRKIKDRHTIIEYNATIAIRGERLDQTRPWASILGVRSTVQAVGWSVTVPMLLRSKRALRSCSEADVGLLLERLSNVTGLDREDLRATCLELPAGHQTGYIDHLLEENDERRVTIPNVRGQPSLFRCNDARIGLNVSMNAYLPVEDRPRPERVTSPSENQIKRPFLPPDANNDGQAVMPLGSQPTHRLSSAARKSMPKVHPIEEEAEEGGKKRALLQNGNDITRPPFVIQDRLNAAAARISALFRASEEFGGNDQFCVQTRGMINTLVVVQDSIRRDKKVAEEGGQAVIPRAGDRIIIGNPDKMNTICLSTIAANLQRLGVFLGTESALELDLVHLTRCYGETNCVDCWPYEVLEIYQIVLIVCAFCLSVIVILGVRAYMIMGVAHLTATLRPGYLNDEGTIERLIKEQEELDFDDLD